MSDDIEKVERLAVELMRWRKVKHFGLDCWERPEGSMHPCEQWDPARWLAQREEVIEGMAGLGFFVGYMYGPEAFRGLTVLPDGGVSDYIFNEDGNDRDVGVLVVDAAVAVCDFLLKEKEVAG